MTEEKRYIPKGFIWKVYCPGITEQDVIDMYYQQTGFTLKSSQIRIREDIGAMISVTFQDLYEIHRSAFTGFEIRGRKVVVQKVGHD